MFEKMCIKFPLNELVMIQYLFMKRPLDSQSKTFCSTTLSCWKEMRVSKPKNTRVATKMLPIAKISMRFTALRLRMSKENKYRLKILYVHKYFFKILVNSLAFILA